jgi:hypothetical protein
LNTNALDFDDEMDADRRKWQKELVRLENTISKAGRHDLRVMKNAGVDQKVLLTLLALAAQGDRKWMLKLMRQRQAALKSLSKRLDNLARETKQRVDDPLSDVRFWAYMNGGSVLGMQFPKTLADDPGAELAVGAMRTLAKITKEQAIKFGLYLKAWGKTDMGVALLLARYRTLCPKMNHLDALARLLTDAFEAAGKNKCFSADGLRKTYKRRATRLLRLWLKFNAPTMEATPDPAMAIANRSILGAEAYRTNTHA